jgi:hypothetical protein
VEGLLACHFDRREKSYDAARWNATEIGFLAVARNDTLINSDESASGWNPDPVHGAQAGEPVAWVERERNPGFAVLVVMRPWVSHKTLNPGYWFKAWHPRPVDGAEHRSRAGRRASSV